jgi:hypothetical protein
MRLKYYYAIFSNEDVYTILAKNPIDALRTVQHLSDFNHLSYHDENKLYKGDLTVKVANATLTKDEIKELIQACYFSSAIINEELKDLIK